MRWRTPYMDVGFLVLVTAAAAGLRWAAVGKSLWLDGLTTSWVIRESWGDILPRSLLNNLSPLFYSLTWATTRLVSYGEVGLRLPSFLAGTLVVPGLYLVTRFRREWDGFQLAPILTIRL